MAKMRLKFTKMQALGNDYVYINCMNGANTVAHPEDLAVKLSDRRTGIGGDGIILIKDAKHCAARMEIYNADGSRAEMCGNGLRCVAKYLYDKGYARQREMRILTDAGVKTACIEEGLSTAELIKVSVGRADFSPEAVPVLCDKPFIEKALEAGGRTFICTCLSVGNPHCVVFSEDIEDAEVCVAGRAIETNPLFPRRINAGFVKVISPCEIRLKVWERGSGFTGACGTGACAAVAAGAMTGRLECQKEITVRQNGGNLTVQITDGEIYLIGRAQTVFEGETELPRTY